MTILSKFSYLEGRGIIKRKKKNKQKHKNKQQINESEQRQLELNSAHKKFLLMLVT